MESFRKKKKSKKPRESQALKWGLGTNTLPSIFSPDLSKVYRKFLSPLQGPRNYIDRTWEQSANYSAPFLVLAIALNLNGPQQLT